jgi:hypothetical protein
MFRIRFAVHALLFLIWPLAPLHADTALNTIAFCADDPSMGAFHATGVSGLSCSRGIAADQSKSLAKGFAEGFARSGCVRFSLSRCSAICRANGAAPVVGSASHGVTFSSALQSMRGFSAESVLILSRLNGFCARTTFTMAGDTAPKGSPVCPNPPFFIPPRVAKFEGTSKMDAFCGCTCR